MTAPVTQQKSDTSWTVRFIMPKSWTMETLPAPKDARVVLKAVPAKQMAVIRFSGASDRQPHEYKDGRTAQIHRTTAIDTCRRTRVRILQSAVDTALPAQKRNHDRNQTRRVATMQMRRSPYLISNNS